MDGHDTIPRPWRFPLCIFSRRESGIRRCAEGWSSTCQGVLLESSSPQLRCPADAHYVIDALRLDAPRPWPLTPELRNGSSVSGGRFEVRELLPLLLRPSPADLPSICNMRKKRAALSEWKSFSDMITWLTHVHLVPAHANVIRSWASLTRGSWHPWIQRLRP